MLIYNRIINFFSFIVIFISFMSIIINFNTDNLLANYYTQISIILTALGIISFQNYKKYKWLSNRRYIINYKTFVDRQKQIKELLNILKGNNNIINIFGIDGIGVTETLCFSADLINKQIPINIRLKYYKSLRALLPSRDIAFYFKIININSKEQLIKELYENMFISSEKNDISITELITLINQKAGRRKLVLMFDEIENKLQMSLIEEFIMLYLQFRSQDTFFIGSHKKNPSYHLTYQFIEILKFNKEELYILAKAYNVHLKENERTKLYELSQGIPVYAYLLLRYYNMNKQLCKDNLIEYLQENILNSLDEREKEIISKLALLSKQLEEINCSYLPRIISNFEKKELKSLENKALVAINRQNDTVSILPIVSDQVIVCMNNTAFANKLYLYHQKEGNDSLAVMYLLLGDIKKKDTYYFNKIVDEYLQQNDMLSLYNLLRISIDLNIDIFSKSPNIYKKYALASITMLLSCGEYKQAQNIFKEFMINTSCFITLKTPLSDETFNFYFLWADTKHLLNHYSDAINIIDELIMCEKLNKNHLCQLYWMKAHCLRHQGKDFSESLKYYNVCYKLSNEIDRVEYIIRSLHGMICIAFIVHDITFDLMTYNKFRKLIL